MGRLAGRNDVTSDKVNIRPGMRQKFKKKRESENQELVWLLKNFELLYLDKDQT